MFYRVQQIILLQPDSVFTGFDQALCFPNRYVNSFALTDQVHCITANTCGAPRLCFFNYFANSLLGGF
jgi:hypothetical protein